MILGIIIACASGTGADTAAPVGADDSGGAGTGDTGAVAGLVINELLASNAQAVAGATGHHPDFVELFNPTGQAVVLDGWSLSDDLDRPDKSTLDALAIEAGGFLLLWADSDPAQGPDHLDFTLAAEGECLGLYAPGGQRLDALCFGQQATDFSLARQPDGGDDWQIATPTPGQANGALR